MKNQSHERPILLLSELLSAFREKSFWAWIDEPGKDRIERIIPLSHFPVLGEALMREAKSGEPVPNPGIAYVSQPITGNTGLHRCTGSRGVMTLFF